MASLNKVQLIGRLGQHPEIKTTPSGKSVLSISMATTETWKDKNGEKKTSTEWHRIVLWEKSAEIIAKYCKKGSLIFIEGTLRTREWESDGVKKYVTEILVKEFQFLDSVKKDDQQTQQKSKATQPGQNQKSNQQEIELVDDDIPF